MIDKSVKLTAKLPKEDASNGLTTVHGQLCDEDGTALIVGLVRHGKLTTHPGGVEEPTVGWMRIEGLTGDLAAEAERLMDRARRRRARLDATPPGEERIPGLDGPLDDSDAPDAPDGPVNVDLIPRDGYNADSWGYDATHD